LQEFSACSKLLATTSIPTKILVCQRVPKKSSGFGMLNNGKVKNELARAQQKCRFAEKKSA